MSKFIIATSAATVEQQDVITKYLQPRGAWWHWFPNLWLFVPNKPPAFTGPILGQQTAQLNAATIRNEIGHQMVARKLSLPFLVLAVKVDMEAGLWGGSGLPRTPNDSSTTSATWLDVNWLEEDSETAFFPGLLPG